MSENLRNCANCVFGKRGEIGDFEKCESCKGIYCVCQNKEQKKKIKQFWEVCELWQPRTDILKNCANCAYGEKGTVNLFDCCWHCYGMFCICQNERQDIRKREWSEVCSLWKQKEEESNVF